MALRTSPVVATASTVRALGRLVLGLAVPLGAIAAMGTVGEGFEPLVATGRAWLVQVVIR